jgi:hypothetical protein
MKNWKTYIYTDQKWQMKNSNIIDKKKQKQNNFSSLTLFPDPMKA